MTRLRLVTSLAVVCLAAALGVTAPILAQSPAVGRRVKATAGSLDARVSPQAALDELRLWDAAVVGWMRAGDLSRVSIEQDLKVPGRTIERLAQRYRGVPVFGADLVRQTNAWGQPESIFGTFYPDIDLTIAPGLPPDRARDALMVATKGVLGPDEVPELHILATTGGYRLTWTARVFSPFNGLVRRVFVDADTGAVVWWYDDAWTQVALPPNAFVGDGFGAINDRLKLSVEGASPGFRAVDRIRPGTNTTYDMQQNPTRTSQALSGIVTLQTTDIASTTRPDNFWPDPAVVSAHSYGGLTYDYFFIRFGRRGLNNNNIPFRLLVNPARPQDFPTQGGQFPLLFNNAAYYGNGFVGFGAGSISSSGVTNFRSFAAALDIVVHELAHGVTRFTSNLIYQNESGALNEAFSDIMGVAAEFRFQPLGTGSGLADWDQGEDCRPSNVGLRSFINPVLRGHPDHYSIKFTGTSDNGGVHINSSIINHMFFLAIMGGTHRLSGLRVDGVGFANREQIEDVIFRAFTQLLPANSSFAVARAATLQAARDLFGAGSRPEQAIIQAWNAVGVEEAP
jgi:thermolysin